MGGFGSTAQNDRNLYLECLTLKKDLALIQAVHAEEMQTIFAGEYKILDEWVIALAKLQTKLNDDDYKHATNLKQINTQYEQDFEKLISEIPQAYEKKYDIQIKKERSFYNEELTKFKMQIEQKLEPKPHKFSTEIINDSQIIKIDNQIIYQDMLKSIIQEPSIFLRLYRYCLTDAPLSKLYEQIQPIVIPLMLKSFAISRITYRYLQPINTAFINSIQVLSALNGDHITKVVPICINSNKVETLASILLLSTMLTIEKGKKLLSIIAKEYGILSPMLKLLRKLYKANSNVCKEFVYSLCANDVICKCCYKLLTTEFENRIQFGLKSPQNDNDVKAMQLAEMISPSQNFLDVEAFIQVIPLIYGIPIKYHRFVMKSGELVHSIYANERMDSIFGGISDIVIVDVCGKMYIADDGVDEVKLQCDMNKSGMSLVRKIAMGNGSVWSKGVCDECSKEVVLGEHVVCDGGLMDMLMDEFRSMKCITETIISSYNE